MTVLRRRHLRGRSASTLDLSAIGWIDRDEATKREFESLPSDRDESCTSIPTYSAPAHQLRLKQDKRNESDSPPFLVPPISIPQQLDGKHFLLPTERQ